MKSKMLVSLVTILLILTSWQSVASADEKRYRAAIYTPSGILARPGIKLATRLARIGKNIFNPGHELAGFLVEVVLDAFEIKCDMCDYLSMFYSRKYRPGDEVECKNPKCSRTFKIVVSTKTFSDTDEVFSYKNRMQEDLNRWNREMNRGMSTDNLYHLLNRMEDRADEYAPHINEVFEEALNKYQSRTTAEYQRKTDELSELHTSLSPSKLEDFDRRIQKLSSLNSHMVRKWNESIAQSASQDAETYSRVLENCYEAKNARHQASKRLSNVRSPHDIRRAVEYFDEALSCSFWSGDFRRKLQEERNRAANSRIIIIGPPPHGPPIYGGRPPFPPPPRFGPPPHGPPIYRGRPPFPLPPRFGPPRPR